MDNLFLGIIAGALVVMAILQVGAVVFLARYARRLVVLTEALQNDIRPLVGKINAIADEAERAVSVAARQVDRLDALASDLGRRIHDTTGAIQSIVTNPVRQSGAVVAALRGILISLLTSRPQARSERDQEEDALFVG